MEPVGAVLLQTALPALRLQRCSQVARSATLPFSMDLGALAPGTQAPEWGRVLRTPM